jgi:hypothetical protein
MTRGVLLGPMLALVDRLPFYAGGFPKVEYCHLRALHNEVVGLLFHSNKLA